MRTWPCLIFYFDWVFLLVKLLGWLHDLFAAVKVQCSQPVFRTSSSPPIHSNSSPSQTVEIVMSNCNIGFIIILSGKSDDNPWGFVLNLMEQKRYEVILDHPFRFPNHSAHPNLLFFLNSSAVLLGTSQPGRKQVEQERTSSRLFSDW